MLTSSRSSSAFVELVTELDIRGVDFRMIPKVELDAAPALTAIRRFGPKALYVICRDDALDAACAERLQAACVLSGLTLGHSVLTIAPDSLGTKSASELLIDLAGEIAEHGASPPPLPPPPSVEPLTVADAEEPLSPFEVNDGPLLAPRLPRTSVRTKLAIAAAVVVAVGLAFTGDEDAASQVAVGASETAASELPVADAAAPERAPRLPLTPLAKEEKRISAALQTHELRALDTLLVDPKVSGKLDLGAARAYCASREHAGLPGWRLPEVAEASSVARARLAPDGHYWTETLADAASTNRLVYESKRRRMKAHATNWKGGRALCVRDRHLSELP